MGRNGKLSLDEVLERLNALMVDPSIKFEETEEQKKYLDEKKKVYYLQFSNGYRVYNGVDFVRLVFKQDTSRREFNNVMSEAEASNNRYQDLLDAAFQEKHGIEAVEVIEIDKKIMLKEQIRYVSHNPETGEDEETIIQEDDFDEEFYKKLDEELDEESDEESGVEFDEESGIELEQGIRLFGQLMQPCSDEILKKLFGEEWNEGSDEDD